MSHGIIAEFDDPKELLKAAKETYKNGYRDFETYTPFPIHGMDDAMGLGQSKLGWIVLVLGATGLIGGFGLQTWVSTTAYKLVIGGKPFFSYPAFIPVTFECMVLFAAFGAVFGMFALNKLPQWYHSIFNASQFKKASSHGFFLCIEQTDSHYDEDKVNTFLKDIGGKNVEVVDE